MIMKIDIVFRAQTMTMNEIGHIAHRDLTIKEPLVHVQKHGDAYACECSTTVFWMIFDYQFHVKRLDPEWGANR